MRTPIKNLIALSALSLTLYANVANAATLKVTIRNLSSEEISSLSAEFPKISAGQPADHEFSFPEHAGQFDLTVRTPSGKSCRFQGSYRKTGRLGPELTKSATSVGTGNPYCHANWVVQKYTSPAKYFLYFNITD